MQHSEALPVACDARGVPLLRTLPDILGKLEDGAQSTRAAVGPRQSFSPRRRGAARGRAAAPRGAPPAAHAARAPQEPAPVPPHQKHLADDASLVDTLSAAASPSTEPQVLPTTLLWPHAAPSHPPQPSDPSPMHLGLPQRKHPRAHRRGAAQHCSTRAPPQASPGQQSSLPCQRCVAGAACRTRSACCVCARSRQRPMSYGGFYTRQEEQDALASRIEPNPNRVGSGFINFGEQVRQQQPAAKCVAGPSGVLVPHCAGTRRCASESRPPRENGEPKTARVDFFRLLQSRKLLHGKKPQGHGHWPVAPLTTCGGPQPHHSNQITCVSRMYQVPPSAYVGRVLRPAGGNIFCSSCVIPRGSARVCAGWKRGCSSRPKL